MISIPFQRFKGESRIQSMWRSQRIYIPSSTVISDEVLLRQYEFFDQLAEDTISACERNFTGGVFNGQKYWQAGGGSTYEASGIVYRDAAMMERARPASFSNSDTGHLCDIVLAEWIDEWGCFAGGMLPNGQVAGYDPLFTYPPDRDIQFEAIDTLYSHAVRTGSPTKFLANEAHVLAAYNAVATDSHLVYQDPDGWGTTTWIGWGFRDSEKITGHDATLSIFRYRACKQLAAMYLMVGDTVKAAPFTAELPLIRAAIENILYDPVRKLLVTGTDLTNPNNALYDLVAGIYGYTVGAITGNLAEELAQSLLDLCPGGEAYSRGERAFLGGQLRWFPVGYYSQWVNVPVDNGDYQNGGGWATMSGSAYQVLAMLDEGKARDQLNFWYGDCSVRTADVRPIETLNEDGTIRAVQYGASNQPLQWMRELVNGVPFDR